MRINCADLDQLMLVIERLVARGLTFVADADTCSITLTGGF
jgi:hypothetical protein